MCAAAEIKVNSSKMQLILIAYTFLLFVALTPGVLVNLPPHCSKYVVLITHAVIFATVWHLTHKAVRATTEGFAPELSSACNNNDECNSKNCVKNICAP
jgi:hypothetical protein